MIKKILHTVRRELFDKIRNGSTKAQAKIKI